MIDQLAEEYSNQPVVVVDYHFSIDTPPLFDPPQARWNVIQASEAGLGLTWVVVDSGRLHHRGAETTPEAYETYTAMIDDALARPATAEINAFWWLDGSSVKVSATVKNNSAVTLTTGNNAGVYAIVKENGVKYETHTTYQPGIAAAKTAISSLAPGETDTFEIEVPDVDPTDWSKVEIIVLVDYQTAPGEHYDQLQAAIATKALDVHPDYHLFFLDDGVTSVPGFTSVVLGNQGLAWTASSNQTWLSLNPSSGIVGDAIVMTTDGTALEAGWNSAVVTITDSSETYTTNVIVEIYAASPGEEINRVFLPVITRP